ncbi:MAG: hypothetical protein ACRDRZ_06810 [Pseudonocardiaceae bacterium]
MTRPEAARSRRRATGPLAATGAITVLAGAGLAAAAAAPGAGWVLPWMLLGLTAGYGLSGSV